jgi:hypothetical protein
VLLLADHHLRLLPAEFIQRLSAAVRDKVRQRRDRDTRGAEGPLDSALARWNEQFTPRGYHRAGKKEALREAILGLCDAFGVELIRRRRERISNASVDDLQKLLHSIAIHRGWPEPLPRNLKMSDLDGYEDYVEKIRQAVPLEVLTSAVTPEVRVAGLTPEERAAGLAPDDTVLLLADELMRLLPEEFIQSLPKVIQSEVRRRLAALQ